MRQKTQWETIRKVLRYIRRYRIYFVASILLASVNVFGTLMIPKLVGEAVDQMLDTGQVFYEGLFAILWQIALFTIIASVAQWFMNISNNKMTYSVVRDLRRDALEKIETLPLSHLDIHPAGEIESRIIADADQFADGLLMGFTQLFTGVMTILGTLVFMLSVNMTLTLVVVVVTPVSFVMASFVAKKSYHFFKQQSEIRGDQTAYMNEMIEGTRVVTAFQQQEKVIEDFSVINKELTDVTLKAIFFSSITNPATRFVNSIVYTSVGVFGAFFVMSGGVTVGQLSAFLSYANQYTKPFNEISGVITELQNAIACANRVFELLEQPSESPERKNAVSPENFDGAVEFSHVDFSYVKDQPLIEDFSLEVKPGQRVAIVGPTGSGKTTLINLLMRFYDINSGKLAIDGLSIEDITRHSLRNGFGMVLQETWLQTGTVRENITMGNPTISEEEMIRIAKLCHIHGFVSRLPQGYDTVISDDGGDFSQGQKQLLCISRVMMGQPNMLILDEATSSIDTRTELKIQEAFQHLMEGRTSFIVAHRLSTIRTADVILVLKDGHVIEKGNHASLMEQRGFYYNLYQSQWQH